MIADLPPPFDAGWFRFLVGFITGSTLGSFGTMLAYRVPRHMSIVVPRSHCPTCKTPLTAFDLVPLLSFLQHGGKCAHCGVTIGKRYFFIELVCATIGGLTAVLLGFL